jgi:lipoprotein-releasing system permease protein
VKFELKIAARYARARRKSLARFTSAVAVAGIAAGVASLITAQALARGFADQMRDKILANTPHISVYARQEGAAIENWRAAKAEIEKTENARTVEPTAFANALVVGKDATSYATLKVQSPASTAKEFNSDISKSAAVSTADFPPLRIGARLAEKLNLEIGDRLEIVTLDDAGAPRRNLFTVAGVFRTGFYDYDAAWISVSPEDFARVQGEAEFAPQILSVSVADVYDAGETAREIRALLGDDFKTIDWQEANEPLFAALSLERRFALAVISLIIFIAALNITATLALLVNERRFDIAILRTCGARARSLVLIFLFEGLFLGFAGIFAGVIMGLLACFLGNAFKIVRLSAEVYALDSVPFHADFTNVALIVFTSLALCLIATVFPALKASRTRPLELLRAQ